MAKTEAITKHEAHPIEPTQQVPWRAPAVDIFENKDELLIKADLPGVSASMLDVRVDDGQVIIQGKRPPPEPSHRPLVHEFDLLGFQRLFSVPSYIDAKKVTAEIDHGVLTVHLPRAERAKPRQIPIKVGG
jgi:HSP20 family molecular chaperone IbpA